MNDDWNGFGMGLGDSILDIELSPHKYLLHADRLNTLAQGGDAFPVTVELDLVNRCNHACDWCVDPVHGNDELEVPFVMALLQELSQLRVKGIVLKGGGEPTLHDDFASVLLRTKAAGFEVGVVTNGSRLKHVREAIADHADYVRVSIDGPTPETHYAVHRSHDFDDVVEGVARMTARRAEKSRRHPIIGLSFAMDYSLIEHVDDAVHLARQLGVDYVLFRTPFFEEVGRPPTMTASQASAVREAFTRAQASQNGSLRILVDHWISDRDARETDAPAGPSPRRGSQTAQGVNGIEHVTGRCLASPLLAVIAADRRVYPCCNLRALDGWDIGRLDYDTGATFRALWKGERRRQVLERIHRVECIRHCTHPMSKYNEVIEYLMGPKFHGGFI